MWATTPYVNIQTQGTYDCPIVFQINADDSIIQQFQYNRRLYPAESIHSYGVYVLNEVTTMGISDLDRDSPVVIDPFPT